MKHRPFTLHEVTEDLAMVVSQRSWNDVSVLGEVRGCPELAERPAVRAALDAVDAATARALQVATIETRDYVAAWLAYSMAYLLLDALDDILVLGGVRRAEQRYDEWNNASFVDWSAEFRAFVASGRAWEMRDA